MQQVANDVQQAQEEAQWQERRLRPRPAGLLGRWLLFGGAAAAMVAAALLSDQLARRYRQQQADEFLAWLGKRWKAFEAEMLQRWEAGELRQRVQERQSECAQAQVRLQALATYRQLDRCLPPPVGRDRRSHQLLLLEQQVKCGLSLAEAAAALRRAQLEEALWRAEAEAAQGGGSRQDGSDGASGCNPRPGHHGGSGGASGNTRRAGQHGRRNAAEPVVRAVHAFLQALRRDRGV